MNEQRIAILTDTGTNVPADFAAAHDVRNVSLLVNYSDGTFRSGVDITTDEVIDRFATESPRRACPPPKTSRTRSRPRARTATSAPCS